MSAAMVWLLMTPASDIQPRQISSISRAAHADPQAEAAVLRGHERAEEAEIAHSRHQRVGVLVGVLEGQGDRDHLGIDEPANGREQGVWSVAQAGTSSRD